MPNDPMLATSGAPDAPQIDFAADLNSQQFEAVTAPPGSALVIAGAGSGKTRTLTYRVAYLLEQGIPADRILLLTFTNKAAGEMMRRVAELVGREIESLWGGTFHSIGFRVLRQHPELVGYRRGFGILDRNDAEHLLKTCIYEAKLEDLSSIPSPGAIAEAMSLSTNSRQSIESFFGDPLGPSLAELQQRYTERKKADQVMDFDDLLALWFRLLEQHQATREYYQRRFQFILVDEFQDTNKLQSDLIDLLAARHHNLMVVGDDAQSIYAWRGANFRNILEFPKRYPAAKVYRIETNYRSTPEILGLANAAIQANEHQFSKELVSARKAGRKPVLAACLDVRHQARFVVQRALALRESGTSLDRMAVLYRSHFHALALQLELRRCRIPFTITSGIGFFEQTHIKDITSWLRWAANPHDEVSFNRLVRMLPGIGPRAAEKAWAAVLGAMSAGQEPYSIGTLVSTLQHRPGIVPKKSAAALAQFAATAAQLEQEPIRGNPSQMIQLILEAGYAEHLDSYANSRSRLQDIEGLLSFARQYSSLEDFLGELSLLTSVEEENQRPSNETVEALRLTTVHQAKGLEFDVVFVIMLSEGAFPARRTATSPEGLEEERRLFYVAMTRARDELYLSFPIMTASGGGRTEHSPPSRFLKELPPDLVEEWDLRV